MMMAQMIALRREMLMKEQQQEQIEKRLAASEK
jgi:hypothetical protein